jgi:hypothetical protein
MGIAAIAAARPSTMGLPCDRCPVPGTVDPSKAGRDKRIRSFETREISFGEERIDLLAVDQLVESCQTIAIAESLALARGWMDGATTVAEIVARLDAHFDDDDGAGGRAGGCGLDILDTGANGDLARPRRFEIAAALNRLRTVRMVQRAGGGRR